jgi:hypothetical protein
MRYSIKVDQTVMQFRLELALGYHYRLNLARLNALKNYDFYYR